MKLSKRIENKVHNKYIDMLSNWYISRIVK